MCTKNFMEVWDVVQKVFPAAVVDDTGVVIGGVTGVVRRPYEEGRYVTMGALMLKRVAELDLTALELRIFLDLCADLPVGNPGIPVRGDELAKLFNTYPANISLALKRLRECGLIVFTGKDGRTPCYAINPALAFNGTGRDHWQAHAAYAVAIRNVPRTKRKPARKLEAVPNTS
jgi:hypothetical protein